MLKWSCPFRQTYRKRFVVQHVCEWLKPSWQRFWCLTQTWASCVKTEAWLHAVRYCCITLILNTAHHTQGLGREGQTSQSLSGSRVQVSVWTRSCLTGNAFTDGISCVSMLCQHQFVVLIWNFSHQNTLKKLQNSKFMRATFQVYEQFY